MADIVKRLPHETVTVGVFRDESPAPGGGDRRADRPAGRAAPRLRVGRGHPLGGGRGCNWTIKAFPAGHRNIERFPEYGAQTLLVDGPNPGSGELFDWRLAEGVVDPGRLMVSGGLRPDNVAGAIAHLHPWGVDVSSGVESAPGVKDPGKVRDFVLAAREAGRRVAERARADRRPGGTCRRAARRATDLFDWQDDN